MIQCIYQYIAEFTYYCYKVVSYNTLIYYSKIKCGKEEAKIKNNYLNLKKKYDILDVFQCVVLIIA